jgi:hypothetical protein
MFNFGKKDEDNDPQKALDKGRSVVNDGLMGGITKAFMGQGFVDKMNNAMDQGQAAIDGVNQAQWVAQTGLEAVAEVVAIQDTGTMINMNPVVMLTLKVQPSIGGVAFDTMGQTMVSKIAIPRVGDKIKIKYNPANPSQFAVM